MGELSSKLGNVADIEDSGREVVENVRFKDIDGRSERLGVARDVENRSTSNVFKISSVWAWIREKLGIVDRVVDCIPSGLYPLEISLRGVSKIGFCPLEILTGLFSSSDPTLVREGEYNLEGGEADGDRTGKKDLWDTG